MKKGSKRGRIESSSFECLAGPRVRAARYGTADSSLSTGHGRPAKSGAPSVIPGTVGTPTNPSGRSSWWG